MDLSTLDEEERKAYDTARAEMLEIKEQKKKVKRDTLNQFIQMQKITGNVFNRQLVTYIVGKEAD